MLLRTLFVWAVGLPVTAVLFAVVLAASLADRTGRAVHRVSALWFKVILALSGVRVDVLGAENIPTGGPVIFLANHLGAFDIPALQAYLPVQFRWVAKKSLFKIPVVGWTMSLAGYIPIDRESATKTYRSMLDAAKRIRSGTSVVIFPEGTRNDTDRRLLPFKKGAFTLAVKSGVPVVPVAIAGTRDIMKRGSLLISPAAVSITFGPALATEGRDETELMSLTREAVEKIL